MKIGLGLITHKRKEHFIKSGSSIPLNSVSEIVVVNDGTPYNVPLLKEKTIQNKTNLGVSKSKNIALKHLLEKKCDYIFLQEDDIIIKSPKVFLEYINLHKLTNIHHFNFALHGPANVLKNKTPAPNLQVGYSKETSMRLYPNCVGAFSFYTKEILEKVGLIDEDFENAFDHVEHTYRIIQAKAHPPFWWFADLANSDKYLTDIEWTPSSSTIHTKPNFSQNFNKSLNLFKEKHGISIFEIQKEKEENVINFLKDIKN